jgi:small subunit ribosomal protein S1
VPSRYHVGQEARVKIVKVANFGAFAELEDGVEGLIHLSELSSEKIENPEEVVAVGQELDTKIIKIDAEARRIGLSIRAFADDAEQQELGKINRQAVTPITLGDMVPEQMAGLRSALADSTEREAQQPDV